MTLQEYFAAEFAEGKIDHWCRAHVHAGVVEIYIHPYGRDGQTTPALVVEGNAVRPKYAAADVDVVAIEAYNAAAAAAIRAREIAGLEATLAGTVDALEASAS